MTGATLKECHNENPLEPPPPIPPRNPEKIYTFLYFLSYEKNGLCIKVLFFVESNIYPIFH